MKKFLLPFQNMVRADLFLGSLAVWNVRRSRSEFIYSHHASRALRGEQTPFELF